MHTHLSSERPRTHPSKLNFTDTSVRRHANISWLTIVLLSGMGIIWLVSAVLQQIMPQFYTLWMWAQFLTLLLTPPLWLTFACNLGRYHYVSRWEIFSWFVPCATLIVSVVPLSMEWIWSAEVLSGDVVYTLNGPWMPWYLLAADVTLLAGGMLIARRGVYWFGSHDPIRLLLLLLANSPLFSGLVFRVANSAQWQITPFVLVTAVCAVLLLFLDVYRMRRASNLTHPQPDLLAIMSHEMRSLASGIMGVSDILERTNLNPEQVTLLSLVRTSGSTLLHVVNGTLDLAQIEAGRSTINREPFRIRDSVEHTLENIAAQAIHKRLYLGYSIDPDVPDWIIGDSGRVEQILLNLAYNGVKFTESGGVSIQISTTQDTDGMPVLQCLVTDTGIGIPAEVQDRLFIPFMAVSHNQSGSGLGLTISRRLAELMGGTLRLSSSDSHGSVFQLVLPLLPAHNYPVHTDTHQLSGRMLLCAEATPTRAMVLAAAVQLGINVVVSSTPRDAALLLRSDPYFLKIWVIEDARETFVRQLKEAIPDQLDIPLTVITWPSARKDLRPRVGRHLYHPLSFSAIAVAMADDDDYSSVRSAERLVHLAPPSDLSFLVVDDDQFIGDVARLMLEKIGHTVTVVTTAQAAIDVLQRQRFAIALIDIQLHKSDGRDLAREIRRTILLDQQPYLVALSGLSGEVAQESYRAAGFDSWYTKPLTASLFRTLLTRYHEWLQHLHRSSVQYDAAVEQAAIDEQSWREFVSLTGSTPHTLQTYVDHYITDTEQLVRQMRRSLHDGDIDRVARAAHRLKSSSAMISAHRLADLCETIDSGTPAPHHYGEMVQQIELEYQRVRTTLREHVRNLAQFV